MNIDNLDNQEIELPDEFDGLPVFVCGGWVRDTIRGVESEDVDLMVAEVSPDEMRERGFREIDSPNNDTFAVFQDSLGREVAIAREEESSGAGHKDFDVTPVPASVEAGEAVKRDLRRRDFTVNAMALDLRWNTLIDPHDGVSDLEDGIIRAVDGDAFKQDPLRIVRGARFASRLEFEIEETTLDLMRDSVDGIRSLPTERLRMEMIKVLKQSEQPSGFFEWLDDIGALETCFPELKALQSVAAGPPDYHKEGSALEHTMMVLDEMAELRPNDELALLMALVHDIGKGVTDAEDLPSHPAHGKNGIPIAEQMADRLAMSNEQKNAMVKANKLHMRFHDIEDLRASTVVEMVENNEMETLFRLIDLAVADDRGRLPRSEPDVGPMFGRLMAAGAAITEWTGERLIEDGHDPAEMGGKEFGDLLRQKRVEFMRRIEGYSE